MTLADISGGLLYVQTEYRDADLIRAVPGARWDKLNRVWTTPLSWGSCLTLRGLFRDRLEIGPELQRWAWEHRAQIVEPALKLRTQLEGELVTADADRLYGFQRSGVLFLAHVRRALLLDEMGTGKTIQGIYTLRTLHEREGEDVFPALVVCPNSMKSTWVREFGQWWPGVRVAMLDGSKVKRLKVIEAVKAGDVDVLVVNWEGLRGHSKLAKYGSTELRGCSNCGVSSGDPKNCQRCPRELNEIAWTAIIADEVHRAKDPKAQQTRALWALATDATTIRIAATGTPIADAPDDLWPALHFLDQQAWPSKTKYVDRWCLASFNPFGGMTVVGLKPETKDEFFAITDPMTIRRPKSLVLSQLPPKQYQTRYVDMAPKQAKAYAQMRDEMITELTATDGLADRVVAFNALSQLTRLTQFACAYAEVNGDEVRLTTPSNKIDALMEIIEELSGKPVVIFAQSRQLIELAAERLEKDGISYSMIVGGQTAAVRESNIKAFQVDGRSQVMLCTIQAGGTGLTLTRADTLVFLQRSWSMIDNSQAEDRVHRIGSEVHESINIIDVVSNGTVEIAQREALNAKSDRAQEFVRDAQLLKMMLKGS
jgi:SNF2 family DNA or RNA helicase